MRQRLFIQLLPFFSYLAIMLINSIAGVFWFFHRLRRAIHPVVFNELVNGHNYTDFASTPRELALQVEPKSGPVDQYYPTDVAVSACSAYISLFIRKQDDSHVEKAYNKYARAAVLWCCAFSGICGESNGDVYVRMCR